MKLLISLALVLGLSGCSVFQSARKFPDPPTKGVNEACAPLKLQSDTDKLSEVLMVIKDNYGEYHVCAGKVEAWIKWYNEQKEIFDKVGK